MVYILEMNTEQAALLVKLLTNKAKEIHVWRYTTKSQVRDDEYQKVCELFKAIHTTERGE